MSRLRDKVAIITGAASFQGNRRVASGDPGDIADRNIVFDGGWTLRGYF